MLQVPQADLDEGGVFLGGVDRGRLADEGSSADFSITKRYFGSSRAGVMNAFKLRILLEEWKRRSEGR